MDSSLKRKRASMVSVVQKPASTKKSPTTNSTRNEKSLGSLTKKFVELLRSADVSFEPFSSPRRYQQRFPLSLNANVCYQACQLHSHPFFFNISFTIFPAFFSSFFLFSSSLIFFFVLFAHARPSGW